MQGVAFQGLRQAARRSSLPRPVHFHMSAEGGRASPSPTTVPRAAAHGPVRWRRDSGAPGWIAYRALVSQPAFEPCRTAVELRSAAHSCYDVSFEELTALWQLYYEPRKGAENVSVGNRYDEYHAIKEREERLQPGDAPTQEHREARNELFDKLLRNVHAAPYALEPRLDKATTAVVVHAAAVPMQTLRLRDGSSCWLRPLEGADAHQLTLFLAGLSQQSFRMRFPAAAEDAAAREALATQLALRAATDKGYVLQDATGRIVAHMDLKGTRHEGELEFDIVVADAMQGKGLGMIMLREAIQQAWHAGCDRVCATVAGGNTQMLKLLAGAGFSRVGNMYALPGHESYELALGAR